MPYLNTKDPIDLLLLNVSNLPYEPFYPYAFVMLSARAKRLGFRVKRLELSNLAGNDADLWIKKAIQEFNPRMIGFTLRQTDSYCVEEYLDDSLEPYYPVDAIKNMILKVRTQTQAPVIIGGYGFTLHAKAILQYLDADLGIKGCVDPLFEHFEDIVTGKKLGAIPNLVYRENGKYAENPQIFYAPFAQREYDEELISEMISHYGNIMCYGKTYLTLFNRGTPIAFGNDGHCRQTYSMLSQTPSIPIEVSRGCKFNCYFCSESIVKGKNVSYRDLDVIEDEVKFLTSKNLREFWFVCSELNMGDSTFALALAERMIKINETLGTRPFVWKAYHLPRWFTKPDLEILYRSGFVTSWNDFMSLDDRQLEKTKTPYRTEHAISFIEDDFAVRVANNCLPPLQFSLFLGDVFLTPQYLTSTLKTFHQHHLIDKCGGAACVYATRVFDWERNKVKPEDTFTFSPDKNKDTELIHPTFYAARELLDTFGDFNQVVEFFSYVSNTLLSKNYLHEQDWSCFLARQSTPQILAGILVNTLKLETGKDDFDSVLQSSASPGIKKAFAQVCDGSCIEDLKTVFYPTQKERPTSQAVAELIVKYLKYNYRLRLNNILTYLELPNISITGELNVTSYGLLERLYEFCDTEAELIQKVSRKFDLDAAAIEMFLFKSILFEYNLVLQKSYKQWICTT